MYSLASADKCCGSHNKSTAMMWNLTFVHIYKIKWKICSEWGGINLAGFEQCLPFNAALQWVLVTINVCVRVSVHSTSVTADGALFIGTWKMGQLDEVLTTGNTYTSPYLVDSKANIHREPH